MFNSGGVAAPGKIDREGREAWSVALTRLPIGLPGTERRAVRANSLGGKPNTVKGELGCCTHPPRTALQHVEHTRPQPGGSATDFVVRE
ncbi:hypothetical protein GCM10027073_52010 [Streptomyces chlorus]